MSPILYYCIKELEKGVASHLIHSHGYVQATSISGGSSYIEYRNYFMHSTTSYCQGPKKIGQGPQTAPGAAFGHSCYYAAICTLILPLAQSSPPPPPPPPACSCLAWMKSRLTINKTGYQSTVLRGLTKRKVKYDICDAIWHFANVNCRVTENTEPLLIFILEVIKAEG